MSWSLLLQNGDLTLDGGSLAQVTGSQKLFQDLRCAILEPMGNDDAHLNFGSLMDGGQQPDGSVVPSLIGRIDPFAQVQAQGEVQRIIQSYQSQQLARAKNDSLTYNKTTLTLGEIIASVSVPALQMYVDHLQILISITTMASSQFSLNIPLPLGS